MKALFMKGSSTHMIIMGDYGDDIMKYQKLDPLLNSFAVTAALTNENYLTIKRPPWQFFSQERALKSFEFHAGDKLKIVAYRKQDKCFTVENNGEFSDVPFEYFDLPEYIKVADKIID